MSWSQHTIRDVLLPPPPEEAFFFSDIGFKIAFLSSLGISALLVVINNRFNPNKKRKRN